MSETSFVKFSILVGKYLLNQITLSNTKPLEFLLQRLKKDVLLTFAKAKLGLNAIPKKTKKDELITLIIESANREQFFYLFEKNAISFGLKPVELEEILGCSQAERKRWTEADRLPVLCYEDFKYGLYPVYDFIATISLMNQLSSWREEDKAEKAAKRKQAAQKAKETRRQRQEEQRKVSFDLVAGKQRWGGYSDLFELAYWVVIADQLESIYKDKIERAKTKGAAYREIANQLQDLKLKSIEVLVASNLTILQFHFSQEYPPDVVWNNNGWSAYFEAEKGQTRWRGFYILELNLPDISERAFFSIPASQGVFYSLPSPEGLTQRELENPQATYLFYREDNRLLQDGKLFTHKQVNRSINDCLASSRIEKIKANREQRFLELSQEAAKERSEILEEQRNTAQLFRQQFEERLQTRKAYWLENFPDLCLYFELAEFTRWVSRAAKSFQIHELEELAQRFYHLKTRSIAILNTCPLAKLTFYRPPDPDSGYYDYFQDKFILKEKDYYSLFVTEIIVPNSLDKDDIFQFHTPYSIGKNIFPLPKNLEQVNHVEKGGRFRFGHPLTTLELLIFTSEQIEEKLLKLLKEFSAEEIVQRREEKFQKIAEETQQRNRRIKELEEMEIFLTEGEEAEIIPYLYEIAKQEGLNRSKAISWIKKQLKALATCSPHLKNYPEYSPKYFHQACNRRWSKTTLKQKYKL